jgi:hypothetical protein
MSTTLKDPSARLLDLASPNVGVPPEPVKVAPPLSQPTSTLLERLDLLRSAAGNSRPEAET